MFHFLGFVTVLCAVNIDVVAKYDLACLQAYIDDELRFNGLSVLPINFQTEDATIITDIKGDSEDIKFIDQKFHKKDTYPCSAIRDREKLDKCVEFHFEAFGEKYLVLAGIYAFYDNPPYLYESFGKARCQKGWEFDHRQADHCYPNYFKFVAMGRKCAPEETFLIAAPIPKKYCINHIFEEIRSQNLGLIGRVFGLAAEMPDSPLNDENIVKVGWEMFGPGDKTCTYLDVTRQDDPPIMKDCRQLKVTIYGKPFSVFFGNGWRNKLRNNPDWVQCQEGHDLNPVKFFPCSAEKGITFHVSPTFECYDDHTDTVVAIGAPRQ